MALYNNPYQYSFGVPGQMNQFQQQPVQMPDVVSIMSEDITAVLTDGMLMTIT